MISKIAGIVLFAGLGFRSLVYFYSTGLYFHLFKTLFCLNIAIAFFLRNEAKDTDKKFTSLIITWLHFVLPLFLMNSGEALFSSTFILLICSLGLLISSLATIDLWNSFGLIPANRGVICSGLYKWVRHPIYLGYLFLVFGGTVHFFSISNVLICLLFLFLTALRIKREEYILMNDKTYVEYVCTTRFKLIPGLF